MQCFLVGTGDAAEAALAAAAAEAGAPVARAPSLARLREERQFVEADRVLVVVAGLEDKIDAAVTLAGEIAGRGFVLCVAETVAPADYKRLVRSGAADWTTPAECRDEVRDLIARLSAGPPGERTAKVVSLVPSKGGVGNTTLAVEVAVHLAGRRKRPGFRVALLDLNLQGGTVADALDLEPRLDVTEIVDRPERLDEQLIDVFASRHSKTLDVFASRFSHVDPDAVRSDVVFALIDAIAGRYDAIVLDLPVLWLGWTGNLLLGSDAVVVSGSDSVPGLRRLAATLSAIDALAIPVRRVAAAIAAVETDLFGRPSRRAVIGRALVQRRVFTVRHDGRLAGSALDVGRPMSQLAPSSRTARDLRQIAAWVAETADEPARAAPLPRAAPLREAAE